MSPELDTFVRAVRETVPVQPDPRLEGPLVRQMAEISRASAATAAVEPASNGTPLARRVTSWRPRRILPLRIALVAGALVIAMAGLAVAGVKLPGPVDDAFDSVGVDLPNQASETAEENATPDAPGNATSEQKQGHGADKGQASDKPGRRVRRHGQGPVPGPANAPEGNAYGNQGTAPGQTKSDAGGSSNGKSSQSHGKSPPPKSTGGRGKSDCTGGGGGKSASAPGRSK